MEVDGVVTAVVSPVEIVRSILLSDPDIALLAPGGVVVGPAPIEAGRTGVIMLQFVGSATVELYAPLYEGRISVICEAPSIDAVERLAMAVYTAIHNDERREVITQDGHTWLVHRSPVVVGPSLAINQTEELWQATCYVHLLVGSEYIS